MICCITADSDREFIMRSISVEREIFVVVNANKMSFTTSESDISVASQSSCFLALSCLKTVQIEFTISFKSLVIFHPKTVDFSVSVSFPFFSLESRMKNEESRMKDEESRMRNEG